MIRRFLILKILILFFLLDKSQQSDYCYRDGSCMTPFIFESDKPARYDDVIAKYQQWHNSTLFDPLIPCEMKKILVFTPIAGIGDTMGAVTAAFELAVKTSRLFFIDWKLLNWSVGFQDLPFHFEYESVKNMQLKGKPLICINTSRDKQTSFLSGHVTLEHAILSEKVINKIVFKSNSLLRGLFKPSKPVEKIVENIFEKNSDFRTVALAIRTGHNEYNQFLSDGDEQVFVRCFTNFLSMKSSQRFRVFVASDNVRVKNYVISKLRELNNSDLEVVSLSDSIVHLMHVRLDDDVITRAEKTFAEFFAISRCDVMFLTHGSLFGHTAAEYGEVTSSNLYVISDSRCDDVREKYSYLGCHEPKYPQICDL